MNFLKYLLLIFLEVEVKIHLFSKWIYNYFLGDYIKKNKKKGPSFLIKILYPFNFVLSLLSFIIFISFNYISFSFIIPKDIVSIF